MIKLSVLIPNYDSADALPNTFYAVSRQKTNFEFEVCFLDDCTAEDPKPLYDKYLTIKNKKGMRLRQHIGNMGENKNFTFPGQDFHPSNALLLDMMAPESEIAVILLSDVIMPTDNILQTFYDDMKEGIIQIPNVWTVPVPQDLHLNFEEGIKGIMEKAEKHALYQGDRDSVGPVMMPFYKKTLEEIKFRNNVHEYALTGQMKSHGYKFFFRKDIIGIHQAHRGRPSVLALHSNQLMHWNKNCPEKIYY